MKAPGGRLRVNKGLDVAQPSEVLFLLLDVHVVGDEDGQGLRDAALFEEALHQNLQVFVEAAEGRTGVDVGALLGGFGAVDLCDLGVLVEEHVLDDNVAVLGGGVNVESTGSLAGLLDDDGEVDGGGRLVVELVFHLVDVFFRTAIGLLVLGLCGFVEFFVFEGGILGVGVVVGDVGDGEADGDSRRALGFSFSFSFSFFEGLRGAEEDSSR